MNKKVKVSQIVLQFISIFAAYFIVRCVVLSGIIGSHAAYFSASNMLMPVLGSSFGGFIGLLATLCIRALYVSTTRAVLPSLLLIYHIPQLFASGMMLVHSKKVKVVFFGAAILLFVTHPIGSVAWIYPCVWLIPVILTLVFPGTILERASTATFAAHVVGSLIYLYAVPMTALQWTALVPIVFLERTVFICGMCALLYVQQCVTRWWSVKAIIRKMV